MIDYLSNPVSRFKHYRVTSDTKPLRDMPLGEVLEGFKRGAHRAQIEALRTIRDEARYKSTKATLPAFTISGQFSGRANAKLLRHSGVICFDVDKTDDPGAELERLKRDPHVLAVGRSAGGVQLFALVAVHPVPANNDQHGQAFDQARRVLGVSESSDPNVRDVARLRGCTYDPDLYINPEAEPVRVSYGQPGPKNEPAPMSRRDDPDPVQECREILAYITDRPGYANWIKISSGVLEKVGGDIDTAERLLLEWRAEEEPGEYRRKLENPLTLVRFASVVHLAKQYGYDPRGSRRRSSPGGDGAPSRPAIDVPEDGFSTGLARNAWKEEPAADGVGEDRGRFGLTDLGNAERLVRDHGENLRYCYPWRSWLVWNGRIWRRDDGGAIERRAKKTVRQMQRDAAAIEDADKKQKLFRHAVQSEADKRIRALISLAQSEPGVPVEPDELDRGEWLLNVQNGTLDLRTGDLRPHRREDLLTKLAPVAFDPAATCPRFEQFLREVFIDGQGNPDPALIGYVQRVLGYAMSASVREQVFFILYGIGANGKGTLLDVAQDILGDYAGEARSELLMKQKRQAAAPSEDEADLHGRRLVKASETDAGRALSEALVKRLTGGDRIKARRLHGHLFEFPPTHKLFLLTNHKPEITGTDYAIWRRVHMIPFNACFEGKAADPTLKDKLLAEAPGILNWLLAGCLEWQRDGLGVPAAVVKAVETYRAEMDTLQAFFDDRCTIEQGGGLGVVKAARLWNEYQAWCSEMNEQPGTQRKFGQLMTERKFERVQRGDGTYYRGILLQTEQGSPSRGKTRENEPETGPPF